MDLEFVWRGDSLFAGGEEVGFVRPVADPRLGQGWYWATRAALLPGGCYVEGGELPRGLLGNRVEAAAELEATVRLAVDRDDVARGGW